jgi:hypothetical protein
LLWAPVDLRPGGAPTRGYSGPGRILLHHSNKWYQSRRPAKPGKTSPGHMVTGEPEPVNVSGGSHGWLGLDNIFKRSHGWL